MSANRKYIISYLLIFFICGLTAGGIHYLFARFAGGETEGVVKESVLSGLFFGIVMVAIILITKKKK